jgi:hypothetical protein
VLGALVRSGQISIADAARAQSQDWIAAYRKFVGSELPAKIAEPSVKTLVSGDPKGVQFH